MTGYKVTITGTIPVDFSNLKTASATLAKIQEAQAAGDAAKLIKMTDGPAIHIGHDAETDAAPSAAKPRKAGTPTGKRRGRKPRVPLVTPGAPTGTTEPGGGEQTDLEEFINAPTDTPQTMERDEIPE